MNNKKMSEYTLYADSYFGFSYSIIDTKGQETKRSIFTSGKSDKHSILTYFKIVIVFSIFSFILSIIINGVTFGKSFVIWEMILRVVIPIIIGFFVIFKNKKYHKKIESKTINTNIYQRQLPSNLRPAHVRMLLNDGKIDEKTIAATLLDLINKDYITISNNQEKLDIFGESEVFLIKNDKNYDELFEYEKFLIEWFIDKCGDGKQVSNLHIKKSLNDLESKNIPNICFEYFQSLVQVSFPLGKYYNEVKDASSKQILWIALMLISFMAGFVFIGPIAFSFCLGKLLFKNPKYILNEKGIDEKDNWEDFKKYLVDFSNMRDKTTEMVKLWDFYLVYSIALNMDSKASRELEVFFGQEIYNNNNISRDEYYLEDNEDNDENMFKKVNADIEQEKIKYELLLK